MGVYFTGGERLQRGKGIGGLLKVASKLFSPLASLAKKAVRSETGKQVLSAVKKQAIDSSINIANDIANGKSVKDSLDTELANVKQQTKRKAIELGSEFLQHTKQQKASSKKAKNKKKRRKKNDIFQ